MACLSDDFNELLDFILDNGCFSYSQEGFSGKSGGLYYFETDIRMLMLNTAHSIKLCEMLNSQIASRFCNYDNVIGVPETASYLALMMNMVRSYKDCTNVSINVLRSRPKLYQEPLTSETLLPVDATRSILIEDSVMTGKTLLETLKVCKRQRLKIVGVCAIFDREAIDDNGRTIKEIVQKEFGIRYEVIIPTTFLSKRAIQKGHLPKGIPSTALKYWPNGIGNGEK